MSSNSDSSRGFSGVLNEFIKGALWGFIAFVHVALTTVLTFRFALNCLPAATVEGLSCASGNCPKTCEPANDFYFYLLAGATVLALMLLPLGFGLFRVMKKFAFAEPQNPVL